MSLVFDADDVGTLGGDATEIVAPQPSGASWDVFGTIGGIFDSAADTVGKWYELSTAKDLAEIERDQIRAAAQLSAFDSVNSSFGSDFTGQTTATPINYQFWSLAIAAVGLFLAVMTFSRKRG